ncbi:hypothetical protein M422DRAFT_263644 [Sphaerobolus stellatus SS14]|uniref:Uncharacterized protein n=1 Tax=Sphaerobolus stellatus (strain SS14) TaxID=990650 RepID=A0A0C9UYG1_SPHS4|nr:hypothetical protein M422DRAFT_263644 [Sphaerobolus stellatus SS14]
MSKSLTDAIIKSDTLLLLKDRRERSKDGKLLSRTYTLRDRLLHPYLRHWVALTRLLCTYGLTIERLRWREQRRDCVERQLRLPYWYALHPPTPSPPRWLPGLHSSAPSTLRTHTSPDSLPLAAG